MFKSSQIEDQISQKSSLPLSYTAADVLLFFLCSCRLVSFYCSSVDFYEADDSAVNILMNAKPEAECSSAKSSYIYVFDSGGQYVFVFSF